MRQLDLFGSFIETPPQEHAPEKKQSDLKKEESSKALAPSYSKNSLRSERLVETDLIVTINTSDTEGDETAIPFTSFQSQSPSSLFLSLFNEPAAVENEAAVCKDETDLIIENREQVQVVKEQQEKITEAAFFQVEIVDVPEVLTVEEPIETVPILSTPEPLPDTDKKALIPQQKKQKQPELQRNGSVIFDNGKITVKLKSTSPFPAPIVKEKKNKIKKPLQKRSKS